MNHDPEKTDSYEHWITPVGDVVYKLKGAPADDTDALFICTACRNGKKIVMFLQGGSESKKCPLCKFDYGFTKNASDRINIDLDRVFV
jgi:hypothetical protein